DLRWGAEDLRRGAADAQLLFYALSVAPGRRILAPRRGRVT
ncbi:hypothetical protein A2U01_0058982, partial [Trifolium medium]|nr:hypothetical protein [Trifolium medium]